MIKAFCVKGKKVSDFLIQSEYKTYPMDDTEYLATMPKWRECYIMMIPSKKCQYKLLKFLFV